MQDEVGAASGIVASSRLLWSRRWLVVNATIGALVVSLLYSAASPKKYDAATELLVAPQLPAAVLQAESPTASEQGVDVPTAIQVVTSATVGSLVRRAIGSLPPATVTQVGSTNVVKIVAESGVPSLARRAADAYARSYLVYERGQVAGELERASTVLQERLTQIEQAVASVTSEIAQNSGNGAAEAELASTQQALQAEQSTLQDQATVYRAFLVEQTSEAGQIITPASTPTRAAKPKTAKDAVISALLGLVLGVGLAFVVDAMRRDRVSDGAARLPAAGDDPHRRPEAGWEQPVPATASERRP
jgi:uncharacterized protein involved in exopolysaccharide biosynthesis